VGDKTFLVKFKPSALGIVQTVIASTVEIHDEHLTFCNSEGKLAARSCWQLFKATVSYLDYNDPDAIFGQKRSQIGSFLLSLWLPTHLGVCWYG
jgi:hypothetical protein